ncbi:uncharacterized protein LOC106468914 [Limulus polyphemus]|uniref:Uncharacterized protein LOC106468914 n=1 Tax=Limulus polyphemus TaxID=6850 RepID=A0ABM1BM69_LIMPO|nr:uncharacterized protein LOC106468914 [Limulus polyphemus]
MGNEVEQLAQLRNPHGNEVAFMETEHSHTKDINGHQQASKTKESVALENNRLLTHWKQTEEMNKEPSERKPHISTKTEVDIPSLAIHRTNVQSNDDSDMDRVNSEQKKDTLGWKEPETREKTEDFDTKYSGLQYSPADLADYIMRTDDEKGVAMAIDELLTEGLMTREQAISYLQDVKTELTYMRKQYEQARHLEEISEEVKTKKGQEETVQYSKPKQQGLSTQGDKLPNTLVHNKSPTATPTEESKITVPTAAMRTKSNSEPLGVYQTSVLRSPSERQKIAINEPVEQQPEVDMAMIINKLRAAGSLYEEYTLKEIIYQLAKDMFEQSILRGNPSAEDALSRFSSFLETQVATNKISREMEQTILDIMSTALIDSLREYPDFMRMNKKSPYANSNYNQQMETKHTENLQNSIEKTKNLSSFTGKSGLGKAATVTNGQTIKRAVAHQ